MTERSSLARRPSTQHYQTFDTPPPKSRGQPNSQQSGSSSSRGNNGTHEQDHGERASHRGPQSPLPKKQMAVLAMIALCEQTAFNSISPYLPAMVLSFPEVGFRSVGVSVGMLASAFALAQFVTNYFWGWLSDHIGRKPVILLGTILTAACFLAFGLCRTLWQAVVVQALMGAVNGNQGLVSACLGEITDRSNQSKAFTYLPVLYGIGGITGPLVGGLLIFDHNPLNLSEENPFPYLMPNLVSAIVLVVDFILSSLFLEESLEDRDALPKFERKIRALFAWIWQLTSFARRSRFVQPAHSHSHSHSHPHSRYNPVAGGEPDHDSELDSASSAPDDDDDDDDDRDLTYSDIMNRDIILLLVTYVIFALCNVSFNSLFPVFAQAKPPLGRGLTPSEIGLSQGFTGLATMVFQVGVFGKMRDKMGNRWSYRASLFGFLVSFLLLPFVGYKGDDEQHISPASVFMAIEVCTVLLVKTVAAVGGLTSSLLLVRPLPLQYYLGYQLTKKDNQLCTQPRRPRHAQWPCTDTIGRRPGCGPVHLRRPVLARLADAAQGCVHDLWCLCGRGSCRVRLEFGG